MTKLHIPRVFTCALVCALAPFALAGCAGAPEEAATPEPVSAADTGAARVSGTSTTTSENSIASVDDLPNVTVRFGQEGQPFTFVPEKNDTALALVRNITESGRNLPIYTYEGFEGDDVMQYYDVPSRYDVPSNPQHVTSQQAGQVYLSDPNRVIVFYQDAQVEGDFTYLGSIADTTGLAEAVTGNPVVEGYSNKIISVSYAD